MSESPAAVAIATVLYILVIVDIVGNSVVCAIIKRNRDMRKHVNYLLVNLAVADILFATFIAPRIFFKLAFTHHPDGRIGKVLCQLLTNANVANIGLGSSLVTMVLIAIERYYAVLYPLGNKWELTQRKLKVIITGSWVIGIILVIPYFLATDTVKKGKSYTCVDIWPRDWMGKSNSLTLMVIIMLSLILMVALYSIVVYSLWFKSNGNNQLTHQQRDVLRVRKRVTFMLATIAAIFGISWGTASIVYVLRTFNQIPYDSGPASIIIVHMMLLFNSAVNPFVYALLNQQFREKMKRMICCSGLSASRVRPIACRQLHTADPDCRNKFNHRVMGSNTQQKLFGRISPIN